MDDFKRCDSYICRMEEKRQYEPRNDPWSDPKNKAHVSLFDRVVLGLSDQQLMKLADISSAHNEAVWETLVNHDEDRLDNLFIVYGFTNA